MTRDSPSLTGKVALVTGAAKGVGMGIAKQLANRGAAVVLADIDETAGRETTELLKSLGAKASFIKTDICSEEESMAAVRHAKEKFTALDILVNNAGINFSFDATTMTAKDWDNSMAIDLKGAWLCCKYAIPEMLSRGGGVIINIASVHATMTTYKTFPYAVAKAGLIGMTKSLALDWGKKHIRVVAVSPGWILSDVVTKAFANKASGLNQETVTASIPTNFIGTPDDVGHLVAFLVSDEACYITGTEIVIDGGISARYAEH
jgi:NAD(P)-dependent dehydrogenase (short-subunit alcohol dehydrogenase family)